MNTEIITKLKIRKPAKEVFEALVNPEQMSNYWFSSGTSRVEEGKEITWRYDEYNAEGIITVLEVEEDKKIVFSWGGQDQETVVTITLTEMDNFESIIEVNESGLKEEDPEIVTKMIGQKEGWVYMLTCLKGYLENDITSLRASLMH
ncbi:SRPBCC family protein [Fictibacillus nanhaiensis]|uniref:SRPBCC family protein n=1 Tax=Fictibacillus nanhaiensis TaxID=742169 RepID=UPI001C98908E|nr:SRPBCC family protein [Fictibacillus nanhaiensis]MBY6038054.1 SRPBCC family protein [Fictibacillus nanhaiensis]